VLPWKCHQLIQRISLKASVTALPMCSTNCSFSCKLGCALAFYGCQVERLQSLFTFVPPKPSYSIEDKRKDGSKVTLHLADQLQKHQSYRRANEVAEVYIVKTSRSERVPLVWMRPKGPATKKEDGSYAGPLVLLHCHANATDMGLMLAPYLDLAQRLGVEVVGVEYTGYGRATGTPSARNTCADATAAYDFIRAQGVPASKIVAYGQSVGSGPACTLAASKPLGGLVLHSPLMSGIQVVDPHPDSCCKPSCVFCCFDFYPNDRRVAKVSCPTFVIHGRADTVVPQFHGTKLHSITPTEYRWPGYFPAKCGHNNVVEHNPEAYFQHMGLFLNNIAKRVAEISGELIDNLCKQPKQVEMDTTGCLTSVGPGGVAAQIGSSSLGRAFIEPLAAPDDGRYQKMRDGEQSLPGPCSAESKASTLASTTKMSDEVGNEPTESSAEVLLTSVDPSKIGRPQACAL